MISVEEIKSAGGLSHAEIVERAKGLAPAVRERAARAEELRRQPEETIREIVEAGLVRILTPKRWGGYELSFDALVDSTIEIAKADASTGWCYAFLIIHSWIVAHFPEAAQEAVWGKDPDALIATSFVPAGQVTPVEGGYRLSGDWPWSSGIDHCNWAVLAAMLPPAAEGQPPEGRIFLLPKSDYQISDTWFVAGQKASGSKNVLVKDAFVPADFTVPMISMILGRAPGAAINTGPLYNLPLISAFPTALTSPILGATKGAYETWRDTNRSKYTRFTHEQLAGLTHVQIKLAETAAEIDSAEMLLRRCLDVIRPGGPLVPDLKTRNRRDYAYIATLCIRAVERLYTMSGGNANYETNVMQRYWRDVHAMAVHAGLNFDSSGEAFSRHEFGLPPNPRDFYAL